MWNFVLESSLGSSHRGTSAPCQDFCAAEQLELHREKVLVLTCSDGAGSSLYADVGSRLACQAAVRAVQFDLCDCDYLPHLTEVYLRRWVAAARRSIEKEAFIRGGLLRDFACTLLIAVVGENASAFAHIGDGAIVIRQEGSYTHVFWPQTGEYANSTNFITSPNFNSVLNWSVTPTRIDEIPLLTDGLQMLALNFRQKTAHQEFFAPMFEKLRLCQDAQELVQPLKSFLSSASVECRTDDDKTLVLAARVCNVQAVL